MNVGMTHREFQDYLGLLSRMLRLRAAQREGIEDELRAHMEERFAALSSQGIEPEQAVSMALAEFGDAAALAAEFSAISRLRKRRWMMRFTIGSIAATVLLTIAVVSMWPDGSGELADTAANAQQVEKAAPAKIAKQIAGVKEQDANAKTQASLDVHGSAEFVETPLRDVLDYLAQTAGVQMYVDRRALADVGLDSETPPVTIDLKDVPMEMVLRLCLRQFDLAYMLDNGVVIVTTPEEAESSLEVCVYRVSDLLRGPGKQEVTGFGSEEDEYDPGMMGPGGAHLPDGVDSLIELITSAVEPDSWDEMGGPGTISEYRGALVISQTYQVHRKVERLLKGLREAIDPEFSVGPVKASRGRRMGGMGGKGMSGTVLGGVEEEK